MNLDRIYCYQIFRKKKKILFFKKLFTVIDVNVIEIVNDSAEV